MSTRRSIPGLLATAVLAGAAMLCPAACAAPTGSHRPAGDPPRTAVVPPASPSTLAAAAPTGTGLADSLGGYTFVTTAGTVPAGQPSTFTFRITGPDGKTVTRYQPYQSKLVACYLIRSDLTGFQNVDAVMRQDGVWSAAFPPLQAGSYRVFVTFAAPDASQGTPLVYALSRPLAVPGGAGASPLPAPGATATVDGYTVTLAGDPAPGRPVPLTVTVRQGGNPVESLNRYLDGYAHLTAFHAGDLAFARIESAAAISPGGALHAEATFPEGGTWRVFVQFDLAGAVRTAGVTLAVPATG